MGMVKQLYITAEDELTKELGREPTEAEVDTRVEEYLTKRFQENEKRERK